MFYALERLVSEVYPLETLESLIACNRTFVENIFREQGTFVPTIIGYSKDNKNRIIIVQRFTDENQKMLLCKIVTMLFSVHDIDKYVFLSEGWAVKSENEQPYEKYESLENHPNRIEVLSIMAVNKYEAKIASYEIHADKTLTDFGVPFSAGGLFTRLLPEKEINERQKKELRELLERNGITPNY
jgi:hypothetical protein